MRRASVLRRVVPSLVLCASLAGSGPPLFGAAPDREGDKKDDAREILRAASVAMGGEAVVAAVRTLFTSAACTGPKGATWQTRVSSARDGRLLFEQIHDDGSRFAGGVSPKAEWQIAAGATRLDPLDRASRSVLRGHEFHMIALAPESRYGEPEGSGKGTFDGKPARVVTFRDDLGAPVEIYYGPQDGLPFGLRVENHSGKGEKEIAVTFENWEPVGPLRLFKRAVIRQGGDTYLFEFEALEINTVPDIAFDPPEVGALPPG